MANPAPENPRETALQSYSGRRLSGSEFEDVYAITGIIARDIERTGSFFEVRKGYAFAYSMGKKIDTEQAKDVIGDVFKARYGQTMNEMRETLIANEQKATAKMAAPYAQNVRNLIKDGETMPYYKALDQSSAEMAQAHGITQNRAKALMKEADDQMYDIGKELEAAYNVPVREAARSERQAQKQSVDTASKSQKKTTNRTRKVRQKA
jgi:hypothetical protein